MSYSAAMPWRWLVLALVIGCAQSSAHVPVRMDDDQASDEDAGYVPITEDAAVADAEVEADGGKLPPRGVTLDVPGGRLRVTPYGEHIVRLQWSDGEFDRDDRFDIVARHDWPGLFV